MRHKISFMLQIRGHGPSVTSTSRMRIAQGPTHHYWQSQTFTQLTRTCAPIQATSDSTDAKDVVRPSGIWLVPKGAKFDQQRLIDQLPRLEASSNELHVILLLVTPKLAHLFGDDQLLHSRIINSVYGAAKQGALRQSIVAVVDALPILGRIKGARKPEIDGCEGIAMCIAPRFNVQAATPGSGSQPLISMTGLNPYYEDDRRLAISLSAPVANTTFINGQQGTLFVQDWVNQDGQQWQRKDRRHDLDHVDVPIYTYANQNPSPMALWSKTMKLTDPKPILHSMGNIVRQVETADGEALAASHELETIVPPLLKELQKTVPTGELRVFALVYPPKLKGLDPFLDQIWNKKEGDAALPPHIYNLRLSSLLVKGARLYRVTSGGAGWGKKAGLLSLEPQTELDSPTQTSENPSFIFDKDEEIRMPGSADLFPPGHIIQFVATFHDTEGAIRTAISFEDAESIFASPAPPVADWMNLTRGQLFCIGKTALPETHQYTSMEETTIGLTDGDSSLEADSPGTVLRTNHFGFLTSSALGFTIKHHSYGKKTESEMQNGLVFTDSSELSAKYKHSSLIELPNSYFLARCPSHVGLRPDGLGEYAGSAGANEVINTAVPSGLRTGPALGSVKSEVSEATEEIQKKSSMTNREKWLLRIKRIEQARQSVDHVSHISQTADLFLPVHRKHSKFQHGMQLERSDELEWTTWKRRRIRKARNARTATHNVHHNQIASASAMYARKEVDAVFVPMFDEDMDDNMDEDEGEGEDEDDPIDADAHNAMTHRQVLSRRPYWRGTTASPRTGIRYAIRTYPEFSLYDGRTLVPQGFKFTTPTRRVYGSEGELTDDEVQRLEEVFNPDLENEAISALTKDL